MCHFRLIIGKWVQGLKIFTIMWKLILIIGICEAQRHFEEQFSWKNIEYEFNTSEDRKEAIETGVYVHGNSLISSIDRWGDKLFMAVPRLQNGVPSTLNYISTTDVDTKSPRLKPYPSWEMNDIVNRTSKKKMISIISIYVDKCNRLWALDTGIKDELKIRKVESPPSLYIFHLTDDRLLRKYTLKEEDYKDNSKFTNIVVENSHGNCENSFAYLADSKNGLVVYSYELNRSYPVRHNYFSFEPIWGIFKTSSGTEVQIDNGIQGMALTMMDKDGYRKLLFHPLVGINQFSVSTKILQNKTLTKQKITDFHFLGERGVDMQSSASVFDQETGVLFYTSFVKNAITCWNSFKGEEFSSSKHGIIDEFNNHPGSYPADIRLDSNGTLWVLTNHFIDFLQEIKDNNIPYRIYTGIPRHVIRGTPCEEL